MYYNVFIFVTGNNKKYDNNLLSRPSLKLTKNINYHHPMKRRENSVLTSSVALSCAPVPRWKDLVK